MSPHVWPIISLAGWLACLAMCLMARSERIQHREALKWLREAWYKTEQTNFQLREQNIFLHNALRKLSKFRNNHDN